MGMDCTFHPLDEALINKFYNNGLEFGPKSVDVESPSKLIQKKNMVNLITGSFKKTAQEMLSGKPNFDPDIVIFGRPYFITVTNLSEVPEVLKIVEQAQNADEIFDIFYRQAEHIDFSFAEAMGAQKPNITAAVNNMETFGALQLRVHDWLARRTYRYAMTIYTGFFAKGKIRKLRPPGLTPQEDAACKQEMKKKPAELLPGWAVQVGYDTACLMSSLYPYWMNKGMGLTDVISWGSHLFPMAESAAYLFQKLPNSGEIAPMISKQVGTNQSGYCIRAASVGQFRDSIVSNREELLGIMDRAGHYRDVVMRLLSKLEEASAYCIQRGFGLMEANGALSPF
jgi:hypothetical protein